MLNRSTRLIVLAGCFALATAMPARGQTAGQGAPLGSTKQAIAARVPVDSLVALAAPRNAAALQDARQAAERMERRAGIRRSQAKEAREHARTAREAESKEVERLERAMEIADELDQEARKSRLERDRELRERYRDLLGIRSELYEREMELAEREERRAEALIDLLEVESRLAGDLRQWKLLHGEGAVWADAAERRRETERTIIERLRAYFEAEREEARQRERVAEARRQLAEKHLEFIERRRGLFDD